MCYFNNTTYTCAPQPRPAHAHIHSLRSSVLCSNPTPCPLPLWETRSTHWPFPCHNCTGETTFFEPPEHDEWNRQDQETHNEAAARYVHNLILLMNATVLATLPATPQDFISVYPDLALETSCRQHPGSFKCPCPPWDTRSWEYNLAAELRTKVANNVLKDFVRIPNFTAVLSDMVQQTDALALDIAPLCPGFNKDNPEEEQARHTAAGRHIHAVIDPLRRISPDPVFSKMESARRYEFATYARKAAVAHMDGAFAPMAYNAAAPVKAGVDFRAQVVQDFSIFAINDPGLSPIRADMVLLRLAGLIVDPLFLPSDLAPEFDTTRPLLGAMMMHHPNSTGRLLSDLEDHVDTLRETHTRELENSLAYHLAFHDGTYPTEENKKFFCVDICKRARGEIPPDANPRKHHTPRVKMKQACGHVMGQHCAFRRGAEIAKWEADQLVYVCPKPEPTPNPNGTPRPGGKPDDGCMIAGSVVKTRAFGRRAFPRPADAAMSGDMEREMFKDR